MSSADLSSATPSKKSEGSDEDAADDAFDEAVDEPFEMAMDELLDEVECDVSPFDDDAGRGFLKEGTAGGSGFLFLSMPAGFRSDSGVIFILSNFGAFGAEAPSKKSAGSDDDADDETDVLDDDDDEEVD